MRNCCSSSSNRALLPGTERCRQNTDGFEMGKEMDLDKLLRIGEKVSSVTRTMGMALTSCTPPAKGSPPFEFRDTLSRLASEIDALLGAPAEIAIRTFGDRSGLAS